jgi:hypothetical protein
MLKYSANINTMEVAIKVIGDLGKDMRSDNFSHPKQRQQNIPSFANFYLPERKELHVNHANSWGTNQR